MGTRAEYQQVQWNKTHKINEYNIVERQCGTCKEWIVENDNNFYMLNKSKPELGFCSDCKKCTKTKSLAWKHRNPERTKENWDKAHKTKKDRARRKKYQQLQKECGYYAQWIKDHPEKVKEYAKNHRIHDISEFEWRECLKVFNHRCIYCDMTEQEAKEKYNQVLHKDHVDNEGYNDLRNAVPACRMCNDFKHQYNMEEWFREQDFFNEGRLQFIYWWISEGYKDYIENKPPYRIHRERNKGLNTFHFNLWSVDEMRNEIQIIATKPKKKDLDEDIKNYLDTLKT